MIGLRGLQALVLGILLGTGCLKSQGVACGDGTTCAPGTVCDVAHHQCVTPDQLTSCADGVDGDVCPIPGAVGICRDGVCLAVVCGDGLVQSSELCDGSAPALTCLQSGYEAGFLDCNNALCAPDFSGCQRVGWKEAAVTESSAVREISSAGGLALAAWGNGVLRYDGASWGPMTLGGGGLVLSVLVLADTLAYAITEDNLYRFDGTEWTVDPSVTVGSSARALLAGTSPSDVYLFLDTTAYRFDGQSWSQLSAAPSPVRYAWASANELWVIALGVLYRGSGSQWSPVTTPLQSVHSVMELGSTVYIGGVTATAAVVARQSGSSWQTFDITRELDASVAPTSVGIKIGGRSESDLYAYAAGYPGLVWFDGSSWRRTANVAASTIAAVGQELFAGHATGVLRESPTSVADISDIVTAAGALKGGGALGGTSCDDVFVSIASVSQADDGMLFHYDGVTWNLEHTRAMDPITDVVATATDAFAVTYSGAVLRRSGTSWAVMQTFSAPLRTVWASGNFVVAAGDDNWVHRFDGAWTSTQLSGGVLDVWGTGPDDVYAVTYGADRLVHFDGTSWNAVALPSNPGFLQAIWGDSDGTLIAVGANGEAWHREQGVWRRDATLPFGGYRALHGSSASDVFAVTDEGTVAHYDGLRWAPVRMPGIAPATIRAAWTTPSCTYFARDYNSFGLVRLTRRTPW
jgi:hypothetical protein